jgi:hypothetical protein
MCLTTAAVFVLLLLSGAASANPISQIRERFAVPPDDARIMMRWWWFGPSVTKPQIERELKLMKEGGIGGFEVQPVYPLQLDNPAAGFRNMRFLSPEFLDALRFTARRARELGLRMDLTLGSGWPFGGPQIPITQAAGRLRVEKVRRPAGRAPVPALREGESMIAAFSGATYQELPVKDGGVDLNSAGEIWFFIASRTRQQVKRASFGAEGYVLDHYDRSALDKYLAEVGAPLLDALKTDMPHAIFCDSLEAFGSDWSGAVLDEFRKRRGYDLKPHLPALVADVGPKTKAIRHDWGRTLTEMLEDRFLAPMHAWSKSRGTLFRIQGYGIPPAVVSSNAWADVPEGEGSQWKVVRASRWASSASHLFSRPVTTSETWTWLHSPAFRATPLDMKAEADLHFLQGINQLIGHGWPYTAEGVEYPGWRFYASAVFNDKNPWWMVMPDVSRYLQRMSYLMRQGRPANDVAVYLPNSDAWANFRAGHVHMIEVLREHLGPDVLPQILESGYGLDFVDDRALERAGRIENKTLSIGDGRYRAVVLPGVESMPPASARKLEEFARAGGIVLATRRIPDRAPGLLATDDEHREVRTIAGRIVRLVGPDAQLGSALKQALTPDVALSNPVADMGFVHRSTPEAEIYFVANTGNVRQRVDATFRVAGLNAECWDAFSGETTPAAVARTADGRATVRLDLEPFESRVIVFSRDAAAGEPVQLHVARTIDLSSGWSVRIGDRPPVQWQKLRSWTVDEQTRYFSGTATYEKSIDVPSDVLRKGARIRLDFGEGTPVPKPPVDERKPSAPGNRAWFDGPVREAAVVYVNGKRAGSVWRPPYAVDVTPYLKPGANDIRVVVANLAINHMAGRPLPDYRELNAKFGVRFEPQDMDKVRPIPSGLLGKISLIVLDKGTAVTQSR